MKRLLLLLLLLTSAALAQLPVTLTVREATFPNGLTGVNRTSQPACFGVPVKDGDAATTTALGLTGPTAGQFDLKGSWPDGKVQWVDVCFPASLTAGGTTTATLTNTGAGNFGSPSTQATDNGTTITVNTGTGGGTFTIRKAHFDVINKAVVNSVTITDSSVTQNDGMVVMGPTSPATDCTGGCTTKYTSNNDASSTASIEIDGPVRTVVKATWTYKDGSGNAYMTGTARLTFWKGQPWFTLKATIQNAQDDSTVFNRAYKGFASWYVSVNVAPGVAGTRSFRFGGTSAVGGNYSASEKAYYYQAHSTVHADYMDWSAATTHYISYSAGNYAQDGYNITQNTTNLQTGTASALPEGWGDIYVNASGTGIEGATRDPWGYWLKSVSGENGGLELRVYLWADQSYFNQTCGAPTPCNATYFQPWTTYEIHEAVLNFHDAVLTDATRSAVNQFLNAPLVHYATPAYYNGTGALMYYIPTQAQEEAYTTPLGVAAGVPSSRYLYTDMTPFVQRFKDWTDTGGPNGEDYHLGDLYTYMQRGYTGFLWDAYNFYGHFTLTQVFPRADFAGGWTNKIGSAGDTSVIDPGGFPVATSTNPNTANRSWMENKEHRHIYGWPFFYFLWGDGFDKDALLDGLSVQARNAWTYNNFDDKAGSCPGWSTTTAYGCHQQNERTIGEQIAIEASTYYFDKAIGASNIGVSCVTTPKLCDPKDLLNKFLIVFNNNLDTTISPYGTVAHYGQNLKRGVFHDGPQEQQTCNAVTNDNASQFMIGILSIGLHDSRWIGQTFGDTALERQTWSIIDGINQAQFGEDALHDDPDFHNVGDRYWNYLNVQQNGCTVWTNVGIAGGGNLREALPPYFMNMMYVRGDTSKQNMFNRFLQALMTNYPSSPSQDIGMYHTNDLIYRYGHNTFPVAVPITISTFTDNGNSTYTLTWPAVSNNTKFSLRGDSVNGNTIVTYIGFDALNHTFTGTPATQDNFWAAVETATQPAPSDTSITIAAPRAGMVKGDFALLALQTPSGDTCSITVPSGGATVSGASVTINGSCTPGQGSINSIAYTLGGSTTNMPSCGSSPCNTTFDSTKFSNGTYTLSCNATDTGLGSGTCPGVSITILNVAASQPQINGLTLNGIRIK